jgi:AhpD family alkylhydroperoxidase
LGTKNDLWDANVPEKAVGKSAFTKSQNSLKKVKTYHDRRSKKILDGFQGVVARYSKADRETLKAFTKLNETALQQGALDRKTKTLMCLAIGIANGSEICIAARAAQAKEAGAIREELLETVSVGLLMGGSLAFGPILTGFMDMINMLFPKVSDK